MTGLPYSSYAHEDEPFAEELFGEQARLPQSSDPELLFVNDDLDSTYTNISDHARRSLTGDEGPVVWFFGGSTLFGVGQRDEHTIPSEVSRLARDEGTPLQVVNFGVAASVSWQEAGLLARMLDEREPPDLIVMYHGANDLGVICRQLALGIRPDGLGNPLLEEQPAEPVENCVVDPDRTGALVAEATSRAMSDARSSAGSIPVLEYWQPFAATRRSTSTDGPLLERLGVTDEGRRGQAAPYAAALEHMDPRPVDLSDALDEYDGPLFFDWAHTNERGARLVAREMWDRSLAEQVRSLDR